MLRGVVLLPFVPFVVCRVAACLGPVLGRHGCAAALKWGVGEWIHKCAPESGQEAPLAIALRLLQPQCTGKLLRGGDGPR